MLPSFLRTLTGYAFCTGGKPARLKRGPDCFKRIFQFRVARKGGQASPDFGRLGHNSALPVLLQGRKNIVAAREPSSKTTKKVILPEL